MGAYRLYFLNESGRILAADVFDAPHDPTAVAMAAHLASACSDKCSGYELWQADRRIGPRRPLDGPPPAISKAVENAVIAREERLLDTRTRIAQSRRLLERITQLKGRQI